MTGGVYAQFFDGRVKPGGGGEGAYGDGWFPGYGVQEEEETPGGYVQRFLVFSAPTTAKYVMLHLAFAAHESGYNPDRIHGGDAKGEVWFRNVKVVLTAGKKEVYVCKYNTAAAAGGGEGG